MTDYTEYKEMLSEKLGPLVEKARELGANSGIGEVYSDGLSRAKSYASIAKLNAQINREAEELRRVYVEIGKLCYENLSASEPGIYAGLFSQVKELEGVIKAKEEEIGAVKSAIAERSRQATARKAAAAESAPEETSEAESAEDIEVEIFEDTEAPDALADET